MSIVLNIYLIELPLNSVLLLLIQLVRMKMEILEKTFGLLLKALPITIRRKISLIKLLMDVSSSQESLLEDHLLLTNRFNIHRCSDYCLTSKSGRRKKCRMEFGTEFSAGKEPRETSAIITDTNGSLRLEMGRPSHACSAFGVSHSGSEG